MKDPLGFIPPHGNYSHLQSYRKAEVVYDLTYFDLLRVRDVPVWQKESREARFVRRLGRNPRATYENYRTFCETRSLQIVANIAICLIHQTNYLLDQQIRSLERAFIMEGGLRERMIRARKLHRQNPGSGPDP